MKIENSLSRKCSFEYNTTNTDRQLASVVMKYKHEVFVANYPLLVFVWIVCGTGKAVVPRYPTYRQMSYVLIAATLRILVPLFNSIWFMILFSHLINPKISVYHHLILAFLMTQITGKDLLGDPSTETLHSASSYIKYMSATSKLV